MNNANIVVRNRPRETGINLKIKLLIGRINNGINSLIKSLTKFIRKINWKVKIGYFNISHPIYILNRWKKYFSYRQGMYIETMSYHPAVIIKITSDGEVVARSAIDNSEHSCNIFYNNVVKLTKEEFDRAVKTINEKGMVTYIFNANQRYTQMHFT